MYNCIRKNKEREDIKMYYRVKWVDWELVEIFETITNELGIKHLLKHPEIYEIRWIEVYEG